MADRPRLLCDGMLGHVTRWLRLMGFDTEYAGSQLTDDLILDRLAGDGRTLVTRDVHLHQRAGRRGLPSVLLGAGSLEHELVTLLRALQIRLEEDLYFSRCTHCNRELAKASLSDIRSLVPERVQQARTEFWKCPGCGQVYWEGTHVEQIETQLRALRERLDAAGAS